jgi:hypothetical protein
MKRGPLIALIIIILVIIAVAVWFVYPNPGTQVGTPNPTSTTGGTPSTTTLTFDQSISNGVITISYPSTDFGLATTPAQVLVHPNIPLCDPNFNYCLYYIGSAYNGTNFEGAGIRIQKRTALTTQSQCLNTEPTGYTNLAPAVIATSSNYAVSAFAPLSNAGAGHYAIDSLYRLSYQGSCYELQTRIGETQFANYPSGTIQEFTASNQAALQSELQQILGTLKLQDGTTITFPQA